MKHPILFDDQPCITEKLLADFRKRGLLSKAEVVRKNSKYANKFKDNVVSYTALNEKLKNNEISVDDAKALIAIEATREAGIRKSHLDRLSYLIYSAGKEELYARIFN